MHGGAGAPTVDEPRSVVITGASRGLGLASAIHLYGLGWRVVAAMRSPDAGLERLREATGARSDDPRLIVVRLDLQDPTSISAAAKAIGEAVGAPDALVHNAGIAAVACAEELPFADGSFDVVCSAFGAVPFVADSARVMREVARVLRPGGRWVFAVNHPMRWIFPDDPGERGLVAMFPYFDRTPYVEVDDDGVPTYVEHHRTVGDRLRELVAAGFEVYDIVEPEWPEHLDREWGQWSPLRGEIFPGTAIFCSRKPV